MQVREGKGFLIYGSRLEHHQPGATLNPHLPCLQLSPDPSQLPR
jgi:hypothetical protein